MPTGWFGLCASWSIENLYGCHIRADMHKIDCIDQHFTISVAWHSALVLTLRVIISRTISDPVHSLLLLDSVWHCENFNLAKMTYSNLSSFSSSISASYPPHHRQDLLLSYERNKDTAPENTQYVPRSPSRLRSLPTLSQIYYYGTLLGFPRQPRPMQCRRPHGNPSIYQPDSQHVRPMPPSCRGKTCQLPRGRHHPVWERC